jgi:hypothetical protein
MEHLTASPETNRNVGRLRPSAKPRQKTLYPKQVPMNKRKLGSIRLIPGRSALKYLFTFLSVIPGGWKPAPDESRQPQPDEPILLSDERVLCADRTPSPTSILRRARWSQQVTHLGKSLRGNAHNPTNRVSC